MTYRSLMKPATLRQGILTLREFRAIIHSKDLRFKQIHVDATKYDVVGKLALDRQLHCNRTISEAENTIGYSISSLNLKLILKDELANVALRLRELVGFNHPHIDYIKNFLHSGQKNRHAWGLIVLLISKAAGHNNVDVMEEEEAAGVLHSQRVLAKALDMVRVSNLLHRELVTVRPDLFPDQDEFKDKNFKNKIILLTGDYLRAMSFIEVATLRNPNVIELMSIGVRDLYEGEFVNKRDQQNDSLPSDGMLTREYWTMQHTLLAGSVLGKSCQSTLALASHTSELQELGYNFGKHIALAWQAYLDLEPFIGSSYTPGQMFNLTSAPVLFHMEYDPTLSIEIDKGVENVHNVDYDNVYSIVSQGPGVELTKQLQRDHSKKALDTLSHLKESDASTALRNIIFAMGEFNEIRVI